MPGRTSTVILAAKGFSVKSFNQTSILSKKYVRSQSGGCDYLEFKSPFFPYQGGTFPPGKSILFSLGAARCLAPANQNFLALPYPSDQ